MPWWCEAAARTIEAGDLAIMSVPARLATAARCLLGRSAVMGRYTANPSSNPVMVTHVARHTPMVMYVTCTASRMLSFCKAESSRACVTHQAMKGCNLSRFSWGVTAAHV